MSNRVNFLSEYAVQSFLDEYDTFIKEIGSVEHTIGYALAKSYIDPSSKNIKLLTFILDNRDLFIEDEETNEVEDARDIQS